MRAEVYMTIDQVSLNEIARRCFRNTADEDYICARDSYRIGLVEPYLWSSLHAIEKYLKGILLFNGISARYIDPNKKRKEYSHRLTLLLARVSRIDIFQIKLPRWADNYLSYLESLGINRYLTQDTFTFGRELQHLDEIVWSVRRYCQSLDDPRGEKLTRDWINGIESDYIEKHPHKLRITGGILEELIRSDTDNPARKALVWKNLFFGRKSRRQITYKPLKKALNSPIKVKPKTQDYKDLSEYIRLPKT